MTRTRTRGGFTATDVPYLTQYRYCDAGGWVSEGSWGSYLTGSQELMTDVVVPNFHARRKAGEVFFSPVLRSVKTVTGSGAQFEIGNVGLGCTAAGGVRHRAGTPAYPSTVPKGSDGLPVLQSVYSDTEVSNLLTEVSTSVLSKRGRSDSNLWESLAEYKSTLSMFARPIARANALHNRVARSIRSGSFPRQLSDEAAGAWLMARYGVRPLLADIKGIIEGLDKSIGSRRTTTRAFGSLAGSKSGTANGSITGFGVKHSWNAVDSVSVRAMSLDDVDFSRANALGFTTKGLMTLPWELMTLSFVADWFANAGDLVGALAPSPGWTQLGSCLTVTRQRACEYTFAGHTAGPGGYHVTTPASGSSFISEFRKQRASLASPGLVIRSDFRLDEPTRVVDALSLLSQRFSGLTTAFRR